MRNTHKNTKVSRRVQGVRYIGFDMDECVGCVHPLHPFTNEYATREDLAFVKRAAAALASCERSRRTGFLRSGMPAILCAVYDAIRRGEIHSAFLFSNNGNHSLVEFVRILLESVVQQERRLPTRPHLFSMAISMYSPERGPPTGIKDWAAVVRSLKGNGLPPPSSKNDLLFFDDKNHVLTHEISHYKRVPAYKHQTHLSDFLACCEKTLHIPDKRRWASLGAAGRVSSRPPTTDEGDFVFLGAIRRFLSPSVTRAGVGGPTTRTTRRAVRKNRGLY